MDEIAVRLTDFACDYLDVMSEKYGIAFHAQPFTFLWMVEHGYYCAASADGRKSGEIIAYSASPMQGRDFNGLTALLNSISKMPTKKTPRDHLGHCGGRSKAIYRSQHGQICRYVAGCSRKGAVQHTIQYDRCRNLNQCAKASRAV